MTEISEWDGEVLEICRRNDKMMGRLWAYLLERGLVGINDLCLSEEAWRKNMERRGIDTSKL